MLNEEVLTSEDQTYPAEDRPRIDIDWTARTITFERCHELRSFLATGVETIRICQFEEIHSVADFLAGDHNGSGMKTVLVAGRLVHNHSSAADMASIFVSTAKGRTRVFAHWTNFAKLRDALRSIAPRDGQPPWSEDARLMPVFVIGMLAIVGAVVYLLL